MLVFSETGILPIRRYQKMHITEVMGLFCLALYLTVTCLL